METESISRLDFARMECKRGKELAKSRQEIMSQFMYFSKAELRRHHLPHHICVLRDLQESRFTKSFDMILELLIDNEDAEKKDTSGFVQRLTNSKFVLEVLKNTLIKAETALGEKDLVSQCKFLSSGAHKILLIALGKVVESGFSHFLGKGWFWLVLRLLEIALDVAETVKIDGGEREAVQRYLLAKFLFEHLPEDRPRRAEELLSVARKMTTGMDHWTMDIEEGNKNKTVHYHIAVLMADMYMSMGNVLVKTDPKAAMDDYKKAVRVAREAEDSKKLGEALIKRGFCYMKMKDFLTALDDFLYVLCLQEKSNNRTGICEAHVTLSLVYQELKKIDIARQHLEDIVVLTKSRGFSLWQGVAYWKLGELLIKESLFQESADNFWNAYKFFAYVETSQRSQEISNESSLNLNIPKRKTLYLTKKTSTKINKGGLEEKIMHEKIGTGFLHFPRPSLGPPLALKPSEYRRTIMGSLISMDTIPGEVGLSRKSRRMSRMLRRKRAPEQYFLDDNNTIDITMNTFVDLANAEEFNTIRCQYGVAKAHEYMNIFFEEVEKCHQSQRARHRIIAFKLNLTPFWENRDQSEEKFLSERIDYEADLSIDWSIKELSVHAEDSDA